MPASSIPRSLPTLTVFFLLASLVALPARAQQAPADAAPGLSFVENRGQWPDEVRFRAHLGGATAWVTDDAVVFDFYTLEATDDSRTDGDQAHDFTAPERSRRDGPEALARRGHVVAMRFDGAGARRALARGQQAAYHNYFLGDDPAGWASRVALYDEVVLEDLYDGVDLRLYDDGGWLRYDLVLAPGADLGQVQLRLDGADGVSVTPAGAVRMETRLGAVEQRGLLAYQETAAGARLEVESAFVLGADGRLGFAASGADPAQPLVIDPLIWSTFLGGGEDRGFDYAYAVDVGPSGDAIVGGYTNSAAFPTTVGAYDTSFNDGGDAFISRLSADGSTLLWSTFLGGTDLDSVRSLAVGADGTLTLCGYTTSSGFPTTPGAFDTSFNGSSDTFVNRLSADGSTLLWSTFLGGSSSEFPFFDLALGNDGSVAVAGQTFSSDFPTTPGAFDTSYNRGGDAFVTRILADGSALIGSTFLGSEEIEYGYAVALQEDGTVTVGGETWGVDFPTTPGAFDTVFAANFSRTLDGFVSRLSADCSTLLWSTFLGGMSGDEVVDLAVASDGQVIVTGNTRSSDFPVTPGAFDTTADTGEAFVSRLAADGSALVWSTFLGGSARAMVLGTDESVMVVGQAGDGFPTTPGAFDASLDFIDGFVTRFAPDGATLFYSSFLGAGSFDDLFAVALGDDATATVVGATRSTDFPTTPEAFDTSFNGGCGGFPGFFCWDAFVTRLDVGGPPPFDLIASAVSPTEVAPGDSVEFSYTILNNGTAPLSGDLFFTASPRGDDEIVASGLITSGTVPPGQSVTGSFTQRVPANAGPFVIYDYNLSIGRFPDRVEDKTTVGIFVTSSARDSDASDEWTVHDVTPWPSASVEAASREAGLPETVALVAYPNPFSRTATVSLALPMAQDVTLAVFDVLGREVLRLAEGAFDAGRHEIALDGSGLPSGVYLVRLTAADRTETQQITLVR